VADPLMLFDRAMIGHDPGMGHPERPERLRAVEAILNALDSPVFDFESPGEADPEVIARVHGDAHIDRMLALRDDEARLDADTYVSPGSIRAALLAAGAAVAGVDAICSGETDAAFGLVRPPGHHAEADRAMGFCLFNNIAIAAAHARAVHGIERVLVVDWDVHHGNGTQNMFYGDPNVLFFSTHQFPFYPGTGSLREVGTGAGEGYTVNVPLPPGARDGDYARIFSDVLRPIADAYAPQLVLVSAGFDAHRDDPLGGMEVTEDGFAVMCEAVRSIADAHAGGKLMLLLEGGYDLEGLARSALSCALILARHTAPPASNATSRGGEAGLRAAIEQHRKHWKI
jgi:acetoin utilization deacetylase AcuC-like enzyme